MLSSHKICSTAYMDLQDAVYKNGRHRAKPWGRWMTWAGHKIGDNGGERKTSSQTSACPSNTAL